MFFEFHANHFYVKSHINKDILLSGKIRNVFYVFDCVKKNSTCPNFSLMCTSSDANICNYVTNTARLIPICTTYVMFKYHLA